MKKFNINDFYMQLKPVPVKEGNCYYCVFRELPGYCEQQICQYEYEGKIRRVYWTFRHATPWDALEILQDAARRHIDIADVCRRKIAQAYGYHGK